MEGDIESQRYIESQTAIDSKGEITSSEVDLESGEVGIERS